MDSASQPISSPPLLSTERASTRPPSRISPRANAASSPFSPETSPTRQQRLLQNRNARFPAKKLSISGLSNKLTQLISNNEKAHETNGPPRDQENKLHKSRSTGTIGKRSSLGILEEVSNTTRHRPSRRRTEFPIYQDNLERPLLQSSPHAASSPYFDARLEFASTVEFDHIHDGLDEMRLRELSLNERWPSLAESPPSVRSKARKRSLQSNYDQEEYIKHLERRLEELEDDACSPLTRRPVKEKLIAANKENERLQQELRTFRERLETGFKRAVEEQIAAEVELKRRVRDLEETLEETEGRIREMQYQHEEKRLDTNVIETLKATIERLEQEKLNMEEINLSMSKRNEVLTNLVANGMSPPKTNNGFDLSLPAREKRHPRPISLILPRAPLSPNGPAHKSSSLAYSPKALSSAGISPLKLSPDQGEGFQSAVEPRKSYFGPQPEQSVFAGGTLHSPALPKPVSRRSTMYSEVSASSSVGNVGTLNSDDIKMPTRRKARRFLAGSTQLKPLLLPTLTSEPTSFNSASTASSPRFFPVMSASQPEPDPEETILAGNQPDQTADHELMLQKPLLASSFDSDDLAEGPGPAYERSVSDVHESPAQVLDDSSQSILENAYLGLGLSLLDEMHNGTFEMELNIHALDFENPETQLWKRSCEVHPSQSSMQNMPMPSTPDSLAAMPLPLFSPAHPRELDPSIPSRTPSESPQYHVCVRKKRKPSTDGLEGLLPVRKHCRHLEGPPSAKSSTKSEAASTSPKNTCKNTGSFFPHKQLRAVRSSDNFVELLRRKDFAVRPLAAMTIRTLYRILATCTGAVREARRDPFALARRVLANAWHMNWKVLGKLSWWVLGLFVQRPSSPRARPSVDWDQYDGESIASRYCSSESDEEKHDKYSNSQADDQRCASSSRKSCSDDPQFQDTQTQQKLGLVRSLFLWGKFSAAIMLAVGGAVIKGPNEMMREIKPAEHAHAQRKRRPSTKKNPNSCDSLQHRRPPRTPQQGPRTRAATNHGDSVKSSFDFRRDIQLNSTSLLELSRQEHRDSTLRPEQSGRGRLLSLFTPPELPADTTSGVGQPFMTGEASNLHNRYETHSKDVISQPSSREAEGNVSPQASLNDNCRLFSKESNEEAMISFYTV